MNLLKKYRILMIFIVIILLFMGSIMVLEESKVPSREKAFGKIMISRRCDV